jgi:hypothetical protein
MPESAVVEFRSNDDERSVLRLTYHAADSDFGTLAVEVRADGLQCDSDALTLRGDGLDTFLAGVAADWRGWDGTRTWNALEHGLSLEATHRGRRVELLFIVRRDHIADAWQVRLPILVAPGEPLSRLARETSALFNVR